MPTKISTLITIFLIAVPIAAADQFTKWLALVELRPFESVEIIPGFFQLSLTFNPGVAFGLLSDLPEPWRPLILFGMSVLALFLLFYFALVEYREDKIALWAIAGIVGGALGNIVDRLYRGEVVDFLDFYVGQYHWPAFNIADSAIFLGVAVLLFRKTKSGRSFQSSVDRVEAA